VPGPGAPPGHERAGLIASLARPGGNVTGLSFMPDVLIVNGLEMPRDTLPKIAPSPLPVVATTPAT
jgi:hypothetical protein